MLLHVPCAKALVNALTFPVYNIAMSSCVVSCILVWGLSEASDFKFFVLFLNRFMPHSVP